MKIPVDKKEKGQPAFAETATCRQARRRFLFDFLPTHGKHIYKAPQGRPASQSFAKELALQPADYDFDDLFRVG
ncbi:MAG: hypothetical protein WD334_01595 [Chitinophagales bacterium]